MVEAGTAPHVQRPLAVVVLLVTDALSLPAVATLVGLVVFVLLLGGA